MSLRERYRFVCVCKDCGHQMKFADEGVAQQMGDPIPSVLEVDGQVTRHIYKRAVMLWVPEVCPECSNLKEVER